MMMPMPMGTPMRLPADVAGAMSRMQGLLQAAQPEIQSAAAAHWLATRQAAAAPGFEALTQQMMMGIYGTTALAGLLRYALSSRATTEVVGGIIDQVRIIEEAYQGAQQALGQFLQDPDVRELDGVETLTRALPPLDRFYQNMQAPAQTVVTGVNWVPSGVLPGFPVIRAVVQPFTQAPPEFMRPQSELPEPPPAGTQE